MEDADSAAVRASSQPAPQPQPAARLPPADLEDLSYADAAAGLAWLTAVGFEITTRQDGPGGMLVHAEVRMGEIAPPGQSW
ncbi:hypothetical protein ACIPWE_39900 [Streptomyces sp. NPDC090073]|uniref:hypothetical protein n=1 Tax=Streptomyces sp. NPDC090073 TaxID=3365936 RepID=UPI003810CE59